MHRRDKALVKVNIDIFAVIKRGSVDLAIDVDIAILTIKKLHTIFECQVIKTDLFISKIFYGRNISLFDCRLFLWCELLVRFYQHLLEFS